MISEREKTLVLFYKRFFAYYYISKYMYISDCTSGGHVLNRSTYTNPEEIYLTDGAYLKKYEPQHVISNHVVCAPSNASDQPAFASHLNII